MAAYTVTRPAFAAHAKTLVANTVDTVTFDGAIDEIEVLSHDGAAAIYFTTDNSVPTVGGASTFCMPAAIGARTEKTTISHPSGGGARSTVVQLKSAGTPTYSVSVAKPQP
jgi:hypothetical protein